MAPSCGCGRDFPIEIDSGARGRGDSDVDFVNDELVVENATSARGDCAPISVSPRLLLRVSPTIGVVSLARRSLAVRVDGVATMSITFGLSCP